MSSHDLNRELFKTYGSVVPAGSSMPLVFLVRARTGHDAEQLRTRFIAQEYDFVWLKRKWWSLARPWELALKSVPITYSPEALDAWTDAVDRELTPLEAELTHWVPVEVDA
ncbi:MAG: hypothetical protein U0974_11230 [Gemmatimonadales bacterium]|nr:hypothetical protein [Gemmatimonadales bacterium]MDZ4390285.1 hypothetical protein [Gemmatimonadales bacterium]